MYYIDYENKRYYYEYRLAKNGETCLATKDPEKYCNGVYAYSSKDPGDGNAFVVVGEDCIHDSPEIYTDEAGINYCLIDTQKLRQMGLFGRIKNELIEGQPVEFELKGKTVKGKFVKAMQMVDSGWIFPHTWLLLEDDKGFAKMRTISQITLL